MKPTGPARPLLALALDSEPARKRPKSEQTPKVWNPWPAYQCGREWRERRTATGTYPVAEHTGNAGCWHCARKGLGRVVAPLTYYRSGEGNAWYLVTLTLGVVVDGRLVSTPARTPEDVRAVKVNLDRTIRGMTRNGRALWAAGAYVFEVKPRPDWGPSTIPCPHRAPFPDEETAHADDRARRFACESGRSCTLCGGLGVLPTGHVHVHLLVAGPPLWWGDPNERSEDIGKALRLAGVRAKAEREGWCTLPGGVGLTQYLRANGWGHVDVQPLRSSTAATEYVKKGAGEYVKKGGEDFDAALFQAAYLRGAGSGTRWASRFGALYGKAVAVKDSGSLGVGDVCEPPEPALVVVARDLAAQRATDAAVPRVVVLRSASLIDSATGTNLARGEGSPSGGSAEREGGRSPPLFPARAPAGREAAPVLLHGEVLGRAEQVEWWQPYILQGERGPVVGGAAGTVRAQATVARALEAAVLDSAAALARVGSYAPVWAYVEEWTSHPYTREFFGEAAEQAARTIYKLAADNRKRFKGQRVNWRRDVARGWLAAGLLTRAYSEGDDSPFQDG